MPENLMRDKLVETINKHIRTLKQGRTAVIQMIAKELRVQPRQVYKWLKSETLPRLGIENMIITLDEMNARLDGARTVAPIRIQSIPQASAPAVSLPYVSVDLPATLGGNSFTISMKIPKESIKLWVDANGNVNLSGELDVKLNKGS